MFALAFVMRAYIGIENYSAITGAESMQALRVDAPAPREMAEARQRGEPIREAVFGRPVVLTASQRKIVQHELLSFWGNGITLGHNRCMFHPDVRFECLNTDGSIRATITLCFSCGQAIIEREGHTRRLDIPESQQALTSLAADLFPDDGKLVAFREFHLGRGEKPR